jgi:hypothetical protein
MTQKPALANDQRLSDRDHKRIAGTLRPLRDGANLAEILANIDAATRAYCQDSKDEKERRSRDVLRCPRFSDDSRRAAFDLVCLEDCAAGLMEGIISIGELGMKKLTDQMRREQILGTTSLSLEELLKQICILYSAARKFRLKGRPPEIALYQYVFQLVMAYVEATGTLPRRCYNEYKQPLNKAEEHPFFAACITAAGIGKYPSRIIRLALKDYARPLRTVVPCFEDLDRPLPLK